jgi:hypothetical protein
MSESKSNSQQTIVLALVVIAVLLAALVGVIIFQQMQASKIASADTSATTPPASPGAATQMPATTSTTPFDVKTATKVPAGMDPASLVKAYNEDVIGGKYDVAYKLLPLGTQTSYGDPTAYATQLKSYGITSYKIGTPAGSGDTMAIAATQVTPAMPITYTWNFRKVGSQWYVESRVMGGTVP